MIGLLGNRYIVGLAALAIFVGAVVLYGQQRYRAGVTDTAARYLEADRKGAGNVDKTTREILDGIGADPDLERLLGDTGGLRD